MEKERTLEEWCDMMVKTYNTSIVENFPASLKLAVKDEAIKCVKSKPNPNSQKNREVLMRLINNYFKYKDTEKRSPIDFIGGPHSLTLHWSAKYNKIIYTFGETHRSDVCTYANMMRIENFFERLFNHTGVFIDYLLEVEILEEGAEYQYAFPDSEQLRIDILKTQSARCINSRLRQENKECDTKRVHFIDIRYVEVVTEGQQSPVTLTMKNSTVNFADFFIMNLIKFIPSEDDVDIFRYGGNDEELNDIKMVKHKKDVIRNINHIFGRSDIKPLLDFILSVRVQDGFFDKTTSEDEFIKSELIKSTEETYEETYEEFWKKEMETHVYIKDELSRSTEETKIREFAKEERKKNLFPFISSIIYIRSYFTQCYVKETETYDFTILLNDDADYLDFFPFLFDFYKQLMYLNAILVDVYTLARIFKKFQVNHARNTRKTDEPEEPHNIIMYAGDAHSIQVRRFLEKLGFELISESKGDAEKDFCVDVRHFEQPFFSSWPPKEFTRDEDEMYI